MLNIILNNIISFIVEINNKIYIFNNIVSSIQYLESNTNTYIFNNIVSLIIGIQLQYLYIQ